MHALCWNLKTNEMKDMIEKNEMIFGARAVIEAIQAGKEIDKILVKKDITSVKGCFRKIIYQFFLVQ